MVVAPRDHLGMKYFLLALALCLTACTTSSGDDAGIDVSAAQ